MSLLTIKCKSGATVDLDVDAIYRLFSPKLSAYFQDGVKLVEIQVDLAALMAISSEHLDGFLRLCDWKPDGTAAVDDVKLIEALKTACQLECGKPWFVSRKFNFAGMKNEDCKGDAELFPMLLAAPGIVGCVPPGSMLASLALWREDNRVSKFLDLMDSYHTIFQRSMFKFIYRVEFDVVMAVLNLIKTDDDDCVKLVARLIETMHGPLQDVVYSTDSGDGEYAIRNLATRALEIMSCAKTVPTSVFQKVVDKIDTRMGPWFGPTEPPPRYYYDDDVDDRGIYPIDLTTIDRVFGFRNRDELANIIWLKFGKEANNAWVTEFNRLAETDHRCNTLRNVRQKV